MDQNTTYVLIAAVMAAVLVLLRKGSFIDALKAFWNALTKPTPQPSTKNVDVTSGPLPPYEERLAAVLTLKQTFAHPSVNCEEALDATDVCMNHLLDDVKPHEKHA